jgi:hypothetical protein
MPFDSSLPVKQCDQLNGLNEFITASPGVRRKVHFTVCGVSWITFFFSSFSSFGAMTTMQ